MVEELEPTFIKVFYSMLARDNKEKAVVMV